MNVMVSDRHSHSVGGTLCDITYVGSFSFTLCDITYVGSFSFTLS
jgi:hypothetical protein